MTEFIKVGSPQESVVQDRSGFREVVGRVIKFGSEHRPSGPDLMKLAIVGASIASVVAIGRIQEASASPDKSVSTPAIDVNVVPVGTGLFTNTRKNSDSSGPCRDGAHDVVMCISWEAKQPGGVIDYCTAFGGKYYQNQNTPKAKRYYFGYSGSYQRQDGKLNGTLGSWLNVTRGWDQEPVQPSATVVCHSATFGNFSVPQRIELG